MRTSLPALLLLPSALALPACDGGSKCGTDHPAGATAALITADGETFSYGQFIAGENNDCPPAGGSTADGVSVTILGKQEATAFPLTLCLPRPKKIGSGALDLANPDQVQLQDTSAKAQTGCSYTKFPGATPSGTVTFDGFCTTDGVAYNMTLAGQVMGIRSCPQDGGPPVQTQVTLTLAGTVLVQVPAATP